MKKAILILITSLFFVSCGTVKMTNLLKKGEVEQEKFKVVIPFEYRFGLVIIKVNIKGNEYDFLFDTGAPNLLSKELAQILNPKSVVSQQIGDSQGESSSLDFVKIDKISIGGINFLNTGAAIANFSEPNEISCLKIDGFIGANLMKKAIWEIDYKNQKITITNSIDSLEIPSDSKKIRFYQKYANVPVVDIEIDGEPINEIKVDLGSNRDFQLSSKYYKMLLRKKAILSTTFAYGSESSGLYGRGSNDTTNYAIVSNIKLGEVVLNNQIVNFREDNARIGTNFFKNFRVILNWYNEEITMIKTNEYDNTKLNNFGFTPIVKGDKIFIGYIYNKSPADNAGLKLGDQILVVNGKDYNKVCWDC